MTITVRRRLILTCFLAVACGTLGVAADPATPQESVARLKAGNAKFVANPDGALPITAELRTALAKGQAPFASILSCADSRVPPEIIFRASLGELFVVRAAGQVTDKSVLASLEYGAEHLHIPLIVVMGHESCGAVKAAMETPASKSMGVNLDYLLKAIRPAVAASAAAEGDHLKAAILENVEESINDLIDGSSILRHLFESHQIGIVGAYYELGSGRVHFSEPVTPGLRKTHE
jgi:carbonic anhydrase